MTTNLLRVALLASAASLAGACTTTRNNRSTDPTKLESSEQPKAGTKVEPAAGTAAQHAGETLTQAVKTPSEREQMAFIKRHTSPDSNFDAEAHAFVAALPNSPESGSVTEAALALGVVKTVLHPLNTVSPDFQEQDLGTPGNQPRTVRNAGLTLESLCKERGINLADAVVENPLLHSAPIAKQVKDALEKSSGSLDFKNEILIALKQQANAWQGLGQELEGPKEQDLAIQPAPAVPGAVPAPGPAAPAPNPEDVAAPNPAELKGGDSALSEAQALADRGELQAAISKAQSIPTGSPMHAMAQEKIKEYSNRAVQDLRRKAAAAFQSAMPITDRKVRAQYLTQAKGFLEEALQSYPEATQLPTVRDNLRVISKDLEKLQPEQGG